MKSLYLVCGVSGSGKSWACRQAADRYHYIPHDRCWAMPGEPIDSKLIEAAQGADDSRWREGAKSNHADVLMAAARVAKKPLLTECPFGERPLREALEFHGIKVIPVFVVEPPHVVEGRYFSRERKPIPKSALSRATSILNRAQEWGAFHGTSAEVLKHLKEIPHG